MMLSFSLTSIVANTCEEIGWRGFALPRLQSRYSALTATLIVGFLWWLWHLPLLLWKDNPMSAEPILPWFIGVIAISFIYTWLYNASRGSLLVVSLFHIARNVAGAALDAVHPRSPYTVVVNCIVAILLIAVYGPKRLAPREESAGGASDPATS